MRLSHSCLTRTTGPGLSTVSLSTTLNSYPATTLLRAHAKSLRSSHTRDVAREVKLKALPKKVKDDEETVWCGMGVLQGLDGQHRASHFPYPVPHIVRACHRLFVS